MITVLMHRRYRVEGENMERMKCARGIKNEAYGRHPAKVSHFHPRQGCVKSTVASNASVRRCRHSSTSSATSKPMKPGSPRGSPPGPQHRSGANAPGNSDTPLHVQQQPAQFMEADGLLEERFEARLETLAVDQLLGGGRGCHKVRRAGWGPGDTVHRTMN